MLDCLNKLIGYVPGTCECLETVPDGFDAVTESQTGKYLSDLMPIDFTANCGDASIWHTLKRARESAKTDFINDLIKYYTLTGTVRNPWTGFVGKDQGASLVNTKALGGIRMTLHKQSRGMNASMNEIMVKTATAGTYTLKIVDRYGTELAADQVIQIDVADQNKWKLIQFTTAAKFPLWSDDSDATQYYILWNAINVVKNESECSGCMSTPSPYQNYFKVTGVNMDDLNDLPNSTASEFFFGIRPKLTIECAFEDLVCAADGQVKVSAAICLHLKWAINMLEKIINSGEINKYTSLGGEYLEDLLILHTSRYNENLAYFSQILYTADCVQCNPAIKRTSIRL
jgi:hypothetical protein